MDDLPSTSNTFSYDIILTALENGSYMNFIVNDYNLSVNNIKSKVLEFSQFLNSLGRLSLLKCAKTECEEFVFLLLTMKKSIKYALNELGQSHREEKYNFACCECKECIHIDLRQNFWTCLQNHDHFEKLYCKFLNGTLGIIPERIAGISSNEYLTDSYAVRNLTKKNNETDNMDLGNENTDSGIDNENGEIESNEVLNLSETNNSVNAEEDVNQFRFNFELRYDDIIESKIYPEGLMKAVRKVDKSREFTIQRAGPFRAVCLLCPCDLVTRSKVSKMPLMDHSMGQRHLRFASNPANISALKKYHETWLNLELNYQAHQVYFRPDISSTFKCILCNVFINHRNVLAHIKTDPHKKIVLETFEKKTNAFYLTELQVQVYGVTLDLIEAKENEVKKEKEIVNIKHSHEKTDSDSSPSSDSKEFQHNIIKSVENSSSENILDLLPNRLKDHLKILNYDGKMVHCEVCKVTLAKDIETVKKHIKQNTHINASKVNPIKYNYYCEICNVKIRDENSWQHHFIEGPNKHATMAESRKYKTTEYECTKCYTVIYGDELSLTRHLSVSLRREKKTKEVRLPEPVKKMFKSMQIIEIEGQKLTLEANDTLRYNQLTKECCTKLEQTLSVAFEGCKAYPFGSRISGLGNKYSDLDVFIDTGNMYTGYKNQDSIAQVQLVRKAAGILCKHKDEFQDVFQIPTARTPIVKLYHKNTEIECDLSFRHGLSVENTTFLRFCLDLQPVSQAFILLLKKWSEHNNLTEHISTYALAIMAIFYLQLKNHLLPIKTLRELNPKEPLVINGWETINYTMPFEQMKTFVEPYPHPVSILLKDFFGYYAKFSYPNDVVCPLLGYTIQKTHFYEGSLGEKLPQEMKSYVTQLQSEEPEHFRAMSPFCIQDPFDLSHNLTKACQLGTINKFKTLCDLTFKHLDSLK